MQTTTNTDTDTTSAQAAGDKDRILALLDKWIRQRPELEYGNYGDPTIYRAEQRSIARDGREAHTLLLYVAQRNTITAGMLREGFRAYSGRLQIGTDSKGRMCLDYCTGQYWPTEYRKAACAVLANVVWNYTRDCCMPDGELVHNSETGATFKRYRGLIEGDFIRRAARLEFGKAIAARWFN